MKQQEFTQLGKITDKGALSMYMDELNEFFKLHKGKRVIARFSVAPTGTTQSLRGYYFNCVVRKFKQAFWDRGERMNDKDVEKRLRDISPVMQEYTADEHSCEWKKSIKRISEITNTELIEHIEWLKEFGAEEFNIYIDDPNEV